MPEHTPAWAFSAAGAAWTPFPPGSVTEASHSTCVLPYIRSSNCCSAPDSLNSHWYPGFTMCWLDITALGHCRRSHPKAPMSHPTPGQTLEMQYQADLQDGFKASEGPVRDLSGYVATCAPQSSQRTMPMKSCTTPSMSNDSWRAPSGVKIGAGRAAAPPSGSASS